MSQCDT